MIKVSVIIPVYNVEKYLKRCLDSVLNQSFPKEQYEIICVNDNSSDRSGDILEKYAQKYPDRLRILDNKENRGQGISRDRALLEAKGEYILYIDSDDYLKKDYISVYYKAVSDIKPDIVIGGYIKAIGNNFKRHNEFQGIWALVSYAVSWAKMYRKEFLIKNDLKFLHRCGEDVYFNLRAFLCKPKIKLIEYEGYYYCFNPASTMGTMNADRNMEVIMDGIFGEILNEKPLATMTRQERQVMEYAYVTQIVNSMILYNRGCGIDKMGRKYQACLESLKCKFPDYKKNPYFGFRVPKGESRKIRLAVGGVMFLHKIHLDKIFFTLLAMRFPKRE